MGEGAELLGCVARTEFVGKSGGERWKNRRKRNNAVPLTHAYILGSLTQKELLKHKKLIVGVLEKRAIQTRQKLMDLQIRKSFYSLLFSQSNFSPNGIKRGKALSELASQCSHKICFKFSSPVWVFMCFFVATKKLCKITKKLMKNTFCFCYQLCWHHQCCDKHKSFLSLPLHFIYSNMLCSSNSTSFRIHRTSYTHNLTMHTWYHLSFSQILRYESEEITKNKNLCITGNSDCTIFTTIKHFTAFVLWA